ASASPVTSSSEIGLRIDDERTHKTKLASKFAPRRFQLPEFWGMTRPHSLRAFPRGGSFSPGAPRSPPRPRSEELMSNQSVIRIVRQQDRRRAAVPRARITYRWARLRLGRRAAVFGPTVGGATIRWRGASRECAEKQDETEPAHSWDPRSIGWRINV